MKTIKELFSNIQRLEEKFNIKINVCKDTFVDDNHLECFWYSGKLGTVNYKNFEISIVAEGNLELYGRYRGKDFSYKGKNDNGEVLEILPKDFNDNVLVDIFNGIVKGDDGVSDYLFIENVNCLVAYFKLPNGEFANCSIILNGNLIDSFSDKDINTLINHIDSELIPKLNRKK